MTPQNRNPENDSLPARWRYRKGFYWYRPRKWEKPYWENKSEYPLGKSLSEAHQVFSERFAQYDTKTRRVTFSDLIDRYKTLVTPTKAKRTQFDEYPMLEKLNKILGPNPVRLMETTAIYELYHEFERKHGLTTANRYMEKLSNLFTKGIEWGFRADHPMIGGKFRKRHPNKPQRYVEDWELLEALKVASPQIAAYVKLKWLTGLRQTDLLRLQEQDIKDGHIRVKPSKTKRSSGKEVHFEITPELEDVLNDARRARPVTSMFLFCNRRGQSHLNEHNRCRGFQNMWRRWQQKALERTALEKRFEEKAVRRKVGSDMDSEEMAAALLGHSSLQTTRKNYRVKPNVVKPFQPLYKKSGEKAKNVGKKSND